MLSPLLFNIFIAAVLIVVFQKFSEDADILAELVYLQEQPWETRPVSPTDCVRRTVWGMLYADDTCIALRSPRALGKMMEVIVHVCDAFGLTVTERKRKPLGNGIDKLNHFYTLEESSPNAQTSLLK